MSEVQSVALRHVRLDTVRALRAVHSTISGREVIVVQVRDSAGNQGWGECSILDQPGYSAEYRAGCWAFLRDVLAPLVLQDPAHAVAAIDRIPGNQHARSAMVHALVDRDLRMRDVSLKDALAAQERPRTVVPYTAVIGIQDDAADLEAAVAEELSAGCALVKLKVDPLRGSQSIATVRRQWPNVPLAIDANGSFESVDDPLGLIRGCESAANGLVYIEQPYAADNLVGTAVLARQIDTPIALDESVTSLGEATTALSLGAMHVLNLKPSRVGGPLLALSIARLVASEGGDVFVGGMFEAGIGRASALALAAQPECTLPTDLGPTARYFVRDITPEIATEDGLLVIPCGSGFGFVPDAVAMDALTVSHWQSE